MAKLPENLKLLTKVKRGDPVRAVASSGRMNAIMECIRALANGENFGVSEGIKKRASDGYVVFTIDPVRGGRGGATGKSPFLVYASADNSDPPYPIIKVYPGKIAGIVPTLAGAKLDVSDTDSGSHPWFYAPGTNFTFFLRCKVTLDPSNLYRPSITEVKVVTDDDPEAVADIDPESSEVTEFKVKWDDGDTHEQGHFYIKIADVEMTTSDGNIIFAGATQWLFSSYAAFVVSDTEAIVVI